MFKYTLIILSLSNLEKMETPFPFLGESSNSNTNGSIKVSNRSSATTRGSLLERAAGLFDLAEDGFGLPEEILYQSNLRNSANYYYFLGQLPYFTSAETLIFEVVTFVLLIVHILFPISYEGVHIYRKKSLNIFKVVLLLLLAADIFVNILYLSPVGVNSLPFRIAPYTRVIFFILYIRCHPLGVYLYMGVTPLASFCTWLSPPWELSRSVIVLAGMVPTYLIVVTPSRVKKFLRHTTLYQMFVLFTTSNNPDVWIPAYKRKLSQIVSRWYSLFFVLHILLGVYFITHLILAVVYDSLKSELAKQVFRTDSQRRSILAKAFHLIERDNLGYLDKEECSCLFDELNKYRTLPKISKEDFALIFEELDDSNDFQVNKDEFADLCHAIALKFSKEDIPSWFESHPSIYDSSFSKALRNFVCSTNFGHIVSVILVINLIAVIIETTLDIEDSSSRIFWQSQTFWQTVEFVFGWIYVLEMGLKIYAHGFVNYWRDGQNRFDFIITCVIVIGETATFISPNGQTFLSNGEWVRYLILARVLRLIRLLMLVKQYRAFVATFLTLIPSLMPYLGTIFCVMCIYSSLGVQLFGGVINAGNSLLEGTDLAENDYLLFNFNDYPNAMGTTFNLLVMGNWQAWMQSYKVLTRTSWSLVYFISFYLITVMLILNLIIAFVLEAFFSKLDYEESDEAGACEVPGKRRPHGIGPTTSSQRVDQLLHRILSSELEKSQACGEQVVP